MDEIRERLVRIEEKQSVHNEHLQEHMRRSALLEQRQHEHILLLKTLETRLTVIIAVGAALIPITGILINLWRAMQH